MRVQLPDGTTFDLLAYVRSRTELTEEFKAMMPNMLRYVRAWLQMRRDERQWTAERTAKSYLFQEAEGLSRRAKMVWARTRGDATVSNLQHDGIIVTPPPHVTPEEMAAGMAEASSMILGYDQPVEIKEM